MGFRFDHCHCSQYQIFPIRTTPSAQILEILLALFAIRTSLPVPLQMVKGSSIFPKRSVYLLAVSLS